MDDSQYDTTSKDFQKKQSNILLTDITDNQFMPESLRVSENKNLNTVNRNIIGAINEIYEIIGNMGVDLDNLKYKPVRSVNEVYPADDGSVTITQVKQAICDANGDNIGLTYATKKELSEATGISKDDINEINNKLNKALLVEDGKVHGNFAFDGQISASNMTLENASIAGMEVNDSMVTLTESDEAAKTGIEVKRENKEPYYLIFDADNNLMKAGTLSNLQAVATQAWVKANCADKSSEGKGTVSEADINNVIKNKYYSRTEVDNLLAAKMPRDEMQYYYNREQLTTVLQSGGINTLTVTSTLNIPGGGKIWFG